MVDPPSAARAEPVSSGNSNERKFKRLFSLRWRTRARGLFKYYNILQYITRRRSADVGTWRTWITPYTHTAVQNARPRHRIYVNFSGGAARTRHFLNPRTIEYLKIFRYKIARARARVCCWDGDPCRWRISLFSRYGGLDPSP